MHSSSVSNEQDIGEHMWWFVLFGFFKLPFLASPVGGLDF